MSSRVLSADAAVAAAEACFDRDGEVHMPSLAQDLNVSRATLYRVVGSRERLLGDVLWRRGQRSMVAAAGRASGAGVERVVDLARTFNAGVVSDRALQRFLTRDPALAFQVLFAPEARVHVRFVELWRAVLADEVSSGRLPPVDVDAMAFLIVRLGESILYADLLARRSPDLELAATTQRAVLEAAVAAHAGSR